MNKCVSNLEYSQNDIFTISARRCKRCVGLLTGEQAIRDGYGHICKMKARKEDLARLDARTVELVIFGADERRRKERESHEQN